MESRPVGYAFQFFRLQKLLDWIGGKLQFTRSVAGRVSKRLLQQRVIKAEMPVMTEAAFTLDGRG